MGSLVIDDVASRDHTDGSFPRSEASMPSILVRLVLGSRQLGSSGISFAAVPAPAPQPAGRRSCAGSRSPARFLPAAALRRLAKVEVFPPDVTLATNRGRQVFVVQATFADGLTRDVTAEAKSTLANPAPCQTRQEPPHAAWPTAPRR